MAQPVELYRFPIPGNAPSGVIVASGDSGSLPVGVINELAIDINVTAVSGTSPTLDVYLDRLGADGVWYQIYHGTQITGIGATSLHIGPALSVNVALGHAVRWRWVLGGTATPTVTCTMSINGK